MKDLEMDLTVTCFMIIVVLVLVLSTDAKKKSQKAVISQPMKDLSDLANFITPHCAGNDGIDMTAIFGGIFLSRQGLEDLVNTTQQALSGKLKKKSDYSRVRQKNRISKKIATIQTFSTTSSLTQDTCCETDLQMTAPKEIFVDGDYMSVAHLNHSYQYVQEGVCVTPEARCRGIGTCVQRERYIYLLVFDPKLTINPPVRYVKYAYSSHCECMNIGRDD